MEHEEPIEYLAARVESLMPRIARRLFTIEVNHPSAELPSAQARVCSFLLMFGESSISDVAEELGVSTSAATQIADRLERTGMVERFSRIDDRRVKLLRLTDQGIDMMQARRERRVQRATAALERLTPHDRVQLIEGLGKLLDASLSLGGGPRMLEEVEAAHEIEPLEEEKIYAK